jgi:tetratricopeptide (TPR) repeat protein
VVAAADRWRAIDPDPTAPCQAAAGTLHLLGLRELSWQYLTSPLALQPNEADPWVNLASQLSGAGQPDLADWAYAEAYAAEPTNADILRDRALLLEQLGRTEQARQLWRQIAEGTWQPRFRATQQQAREKLTPP